MPVGETCPENHPKMGLKRQFQAKTPKSKTTPKLQIQSTRNLNASYDQQLHFVGGLSFPYTKSNMANGRHLENRDDVISQLRRVQFE